MSKPYIGQEYWTISHRLGSMEVVKTNFDGDVFDKAKSADCNMFKTKDQALAALDRIKAALRNDCDTTCRYLHGHKLKPGDIITTEDRTGGRHVLQYIRDDWFYDIGRGGEYGTTLSYFAIVREYELKNMQVNGIYRPDGFDVIFSVIDERRLPQRYIVWEKDDAREMTIADIEKELGYRIKVIKES